MGIMYSIYSATDEQVCVSDNGIYSRDNCYAENRILVFLVTEHCTML